MELDTETASARQLLGPADLFSARSREHRLPQRSHGQKDFIPDHSEAQDEKLRQCHEEQWQLLSEERIERLGSLVKAEWKSRKGFVLLKSPAGKFWHTMGFTRQGKQCLLPEEALYLLECGSIQLFYRDLPLSVQEAYERLLPRDRTSLLRYQVFSHLKRLGYILMRFDASTVQSSYERQLNIERSGRRSARSRRKRKRSPSPCFQGKKGKLNKNVPDSDCAGEGKTESTAVVSLGMPNAQSDWSEEPCSSNGVQPAKNTNGAEHCHNVDHQSQTRTGNDCLVSQPARPEGSNSICSPRWDLTDISFPNLASDSLQTHLLQPDSALLPENVTGREVDISGWRQRLNQRRERLSRQEQEQLEWESRYKNSINADVEVKQCRGWREYKELLRQRSQRGASQRPPSLWNQAVTPLVQPSQVQSLGAVTQATTLVLVDPPFCLYQYLVLKGKTGEVRYSSLLAVQAGKSNTSLLEQLGILQTSHILDGTARLQEDAEEISIDFDVYQSDAVVDFKKSNPGKPYARMCVRRFDEEIPDLRAIKQLTRRSGDVPVIFALVDSGDIAFYSFKDFSLPVDQYP